MASEPGQEIQTALFDAVSADNPDSVSRALQAGADPNGRDRHGVPPLARLDFMSPKQPRAGMSEIVARLVAAGADPFAPEYPDGGDSALVRHILYSEGAWVEHFIRGLPHGIFDREVPARTLPTLAAWYDCENLSSLEPLKIFSLMIEKGVNVNARDIHGRTALMHAVSQTRAVRGNSFIADSGIGLALLKAGADPNICDHEGKSALFYPVRTQHAHDLLNFRADPKILDHQGRTPLFYLSENSVLQALIDRGVDPLIRDQEGKAAWEVNTCSGARTALWKYRNPQNQNRPTLGAAQVNLKQEPAEPGTGERLWQALRRFWGAD